jgi:hypothetical protein
MGSNEQNSGQHDDHGRRGGVPPATVAVLAASAVVVAGVSMRVAGKAGYPAPLGLLMLVTPLNVILGIAFALAEWPIERELRERRAAPPTS